MCLAQLSSCPESQLHPNLLRGQLLSPKGQSRPGGLEPSAAATPDPEEAVKPPLGPKDPEAALPTGSTKPRLRPGEGWVLGHLPHPRPSRRGFSSKGIGVGALRSASPNRCCQPGRLGVPRTSPERTQQAPSPSDLAVLPLKSILSKTSEHLRAASRPLGLGSQIPGGDEQCSLVPVQFAWGTPSSFVLLTCSRRWPPAHS